jgi:hypothetical protein
MQQVLLTAQIGVSRERLPAFTSAVCYGVLQADNSSPTASGSSSYHARSSPPCATQRQVSPLVEAFEGPVDTTNPFFQHGSCIVGIT